MPRWDGLSPEARFWASATKTAGCWEWQLARTDSGYGSAKFKGRQRRAHRVAWELEHGEVPGDLCVLHHCDNPRCVRPGHLFLGTHQDNAADRDAKGRQARGERITATRSTARRERHGRAKLTIAAAQQIRDRYAAGGLFLKHLAAEYSVGISTIHRVVHGLNWAEAA